MDEAAIIQYILDTCDDAQTTTLDGDTYVFHGPDRMMPFITLVTGDRHDTVSDLERAGVFRLNIGVSKATFLSLFGARLAPTDAGGGDASEYDFTALDRVMPHPVYGRLYWVCILNPSAETFQTVVRPLIAEAHALAAGKQARRAARG